ncbi:hypothetical protein BASA83_011561 [Batrachochytrium salamandrivorans]|nr:hypothetical protein BASA83_011561 [Batrachochytrium salamandrivorans]
MSPTLKKVIWSIFIESHHVSALLQTVPWFEHWQRDLAWPTSSKFRAINSEFSSIRSISSRGAKVFRGESLVRVQACILSTIPLVVDVRSRCQVSDLVLSLKQVDPSAKKDLPRSEMISNGAPYVIINS